ncbi:hypothetical protein XENTR_v10007864 [Xenopus tropicalis]|nr:hypothetical protein XENTR_v10007864 [Xenopus tropicalis]
MPVQILHITQCNIICTDINTDLQAAQCSLFGKGLFQQEQQKSFRFHQKRKMEQKEPVSEETGGPLGRKQHITVCWCDITSVPNMHYFLGPNWRKNSPGLKTLLHMRGCYHLPMASKTHIRLVTHWPGPFTSRLSFLV